jgi:hypothetical protein
MLGLRNIIRKFAPQTTAKQLVINNLKSLAKPLVPPSFAAKFRSRKDPLCGLGKPKFAAFWAVYIRNSISIYSFCLMKICGMIVFRWHRDAFKVGATRSRTRDRRIGENACSRVLKGSVLEVQREGSLP